MFTPDAAIRQVQGEGILLLGGGRALLMQLAHPQVARGVAEHSDFRTDPVGRLLRTLRPMYAMAFGTPAQAARAAAAIRGVHEGVRGRGYRAGDPALLAWVMATLIDTALLVHHRFVSPLPLAVQRDYYQDMRRIGEVLEMPGDALPADLEGFHDYVLATTASLRVSREARLIARDLFAPSPAAPWLTPAMPLVREATSGLLPPLLRDEYGLTWGPARAATLSVAADLSRRVVPHLPRALRAPPRLLPPPPAAAGPVSPLA